MEIMQVVGSLVCSYRVGGLDHMHLRVLENNKGKQLVAVDPVGAPQGTGSSQRVVRQPALLARIQRCKPISLSAESLIFGLPTADPDLNAPP